MRRVISRGSWGATRRVKTSSTGCLRARLFVDLHTILKRTVRASVEQYSLKALEVFHDFERKVNLDAPDTPRARCSIVGACRGCADRRNGSRNGWRFTMPTNCFSTWSLHKWLERLRLLSEQAGHVLPRPTPSDGAPPKRWNERQQRTAALAARLQAGVPDDPNSGMRTISTLATLESSGRAPPGIEVGMVGNSTVSENCPMKTCSTRSRLCQGCTS